MFRLAWTCFRWALAHCLVWASQPEYRNMLRFQKWAAEHGDLGNLFAIDKSRFYEPMYKAVHGTYPIHRVGKPKEKA